MKQVLNITDIDNYGKHVMTVLLNKNYSYNYIYERVESAKQKWQEEGIKDDLASYLKKALKDIIEEEVDCINYNL